MWDLPRPGIKPVSPALAGRFLTTVPPGKSLEQTIFIWHSKQDCEVEMSALFQLSDWENSKANWELRKSWALRLWILTPVLFALYHMDSKQEKQKWRCLAGHHLYSHFTVSTSFGLLGLVSSYVVTIIISELMHGTCRRYAFLFICPCFPINSLLCFPEYSSKLLNIPPKH